MLLDEALQLHSKLNGGIVITNWYLVVIWTLLLSGCGVRIENRSAQGRHVLEQHKTELIAGPIEKRVFDFDLEDS